MSGTGNPQDAYDLLMEGAQLPDLVLMLEHIGLYGLRGGQTGWGMNINQTVDTETVNGRIREGQTYKLGRAEVIRGGRDITLVTWGAMVHIALQAAEALAGEDIEVEVVDLRTLIPFDSATCVASVQRTGRLVVLQEGQWSGGLGHTLQSRIMEECFYELESAPTVIGALDTPVPFSPPWRITPSPPSNTSSRCFVLRSRLDIVGKESTLEIDGQPSTERR